MEEGAKLDSEQPDRLTEAIVGAAITVHRELGAGLLESIYESCFVLELESRGLRVERQKPVAIVYRGFHIESAFRIDMLVEDKVIVELKAVERLLPIHQAQLVSYLKLSRHRVGLLINFNVPLLKSGVRRFEV